MTRSEKQLSFLALCARAQGHPTQYQLLREQAANLTDWNTLPTEAENHGLAPLVYAHLQVAGILVPASIKEQLQISGELLKIAPLKIGRPPSGIGQEFQGWSRYALAVQQHKGYFGIVHDTFFPSEWWLRCYYGLSAGPSTKLRIDPALWWGRVVRHPLHILGWVGHYFRGK